MSNMLALDNPKANLNDEFSPAGAVLPLQLYSKGPEAAQSEPLQRLMTAMLVDAVRCFQTKFAARHARRQEFAEVRSWIFSTRDNSVFSFKAVCEALEIDPEAIRKRLTQWEERKFSRAMPRKRSRRQALPDALAAAGV